MSRRLPLLIVALLASGCVRGTGDAPEAPPQQVKVDPPRKHLSTPHRPNPLPQQTQTPPQQPVGNNQPTTTLGPEYDVYEALVREGLKGGSANPAPPTVFVSLNGNDPPVEFLRRFDGHRIPVKAAGTMPEKDPPQWVNVRLGEVQFTNPDQARVMGRWTAWCVQEKCGTPYPMYAERQNGKWVAVHK
jgi:hypothetical protein